MAITVTFKGEDEVRNLINNIEQAIIYNLFAVGEELLTVARSYGPKTWQDQTGNLRSSIGYGVTYNGELVKVSEFDSVATGDEGAETGRKYLEKLAKTHPTGIALICVAGMNYASYLYDRGYDVLVSAELLAQKAIPEMLKSLKI